MSEPTCKTCPMFRRPFGEGPTGECVYNPPIPMMEHQTAPSFVVINEDRVCGKHPELRVVYEAACNAVRLEKIPKLIEEVLQAATKPTGADTAGNPSLAELFQSIAKAMNINIEADDAMMQELSEILNRDPKNTNKPN